MPKGKNQKFKLYRLAQIMLENTDEEHYITMPEIKEKLEEYEVTADRKSLYNDLKDLEKLGIEVEGEPVGNRYHYHVVERPFELPELKLLVDAIPLSVLCGTGRAAAPALRLRSSGTRGQRSRSGRALRHGHHHAGGRRRHSGKAAGRSGRGHRQCDVLRLRRAAYSGRSGLLQLPGLLAGGRRSPVLSHQLSGIHRRAGGPGVPAGDGLIAK